MKEVGEKIKRLKRMTRNRLCSTFAWWIRRENSWKLRSKNTFSCFEKIKRSLRVPPFSLSGDCHKNCNFPNLWIHYYIFESQLSVSAGVDDDSMAWHLAGWRQNGRPSCLPGGLIENWGDKRMIFTLFEHHVVIDVR